MKNLKHILIALTLSTSLAFSQTTDPAQYKRVTPKYEINEFVEKSGSFDIVVNADSDHKTVVKGKLKDYDYLNFDSKTFSSTKAIVKHYSDLVTKAGGTLVSKNESIMCSNEDGYDSGLGSGAVFKMNEKESWVIVIARNIGNYKLLIIE